MTPAVITRVRKASRRVSGSAPHEAPVEDQADLVGAADVEVVADDLLEEDPPRHRRIEHLGQREFGLQDRGLVAVAGGLILGGERVRQIAQPLAQQRVDVLGSQTVADPLQPVHVVDGGEPIVERFEADTGLGGLAFGPFVAVDAQLGGVGKVGAELDDSTFAVSGDPVTVRAGRP